jgi:hypothetical protein
MAEVQDINIITKEKSVKTVAFFVGAYYENAKSPLFINETFALCAICVYGTDSGALYPFGGQ